MKALLSTIHVVGIKSIGSHHSSIHISKLSTWISDGITRKREQYIMYRILFHIFLFQHLHFYQFRRRSNAFFCDFTFSKRCRCRRISGRRILVHEIARNRRGYTVELDPRGGNAVPEIRLVRVDIHHPKILGDSGKRSLSICIGSVLLVKFKDCVAHRKSSDGLCPYTRIHRGQTESQGLTASLSDEPFWQHIECPLCVPICIPSVSSR